MKNTSKRIFLFIAMTLVAIIVATTFVACNFLTTQQTDGSGNDDTTKVTYSVTINANGGQFDDGNTVKVVTVQQGATISLPSMPTRGGYTLVGFATDRNGRNMFDMDTLINQNITLFAIWEENTDDHPTTVEYTVTIYANGGQFSDGSTSKVIKVVDGQTLNLSDVPTREGYLLVGFATDSRGRHPWDDDSAITGSISIYVIWEQIEEPTAEHDVTFYLNNGSSSSVVRSTENGKVTYVPTRSGYEFYGWYTDEYLTNVWNMNATVTNDDLVLYAEWIEAATIGQLAAPKVTVSGDTFSWDRISGASGYNVVVVLNNEEKYSQTFSSNTNQWTFPSSLIPDEAGIYNFSVKIRANGDGENTTNSNYNVKTLKKNVRVLDGLTGIAFDEATGVLSWNPVEYAEEYTVSLNGKVEGTVTTNSFDMSSYEAGDYRAIITATKENWQSSSANKSFTKRRLLEPKVYVSVTQNNNGGYDYYLRWNSALNADTHVLAFGNETITVNTNNYTLASSSSLWSDKDTLEFTIQAKDSGADYLNSPSKEKYTLQKLGGKISVENSFGGSDGITITGKAYSPTRYIFDLNYNDLSFSRALIADQDFEYPHPKRAGYIFTGWYTTPECEKLHNFYTDLYEDTTVYAGWYACENSMEVIEWSDNPTLTAYSLRAYETKDIYFAVYNSQGYQFLYKNQNSSSSYAVTFEMYDVTYDAVHFNAVTCTNTSNNVRSGNWNAGRVFRLRITGGSNPTTAYCALMVGANTLHKYPTVSHAPYIPYSLQDGEISGDIIALLGNKYTLNATPRAGYTWVGWYKGDEKISDERTCEITATSSRTNYTAEWVYYTVSTDTNLDGAGTYTEYADHKVTVGDSVTITAATNNGYTWLGWYDGDTKVCDDLSYTFAMPAEDKTYTAKWSKVTLERNNTSAGTVTSLTSTYIVGEEVTITATTNNGYTWIGWYDGETKISDDLSYTITMPAEDKTYIAKWQLDEVMSNFNFTSTPTTCTITGVKDKTVTEIVIPNFVTNIGEYAFYNCTGLTSITIPNSVTSIGYGAFSGCSSLESITIPFVGAVAGKTASQTYQYPFGYIFGTSSYTSGTEVRQYYYESSTSTTTNKKYYIPSTLRSVTVTGGNILRGAFYNCSMLTSITIPDSVTSIGEDAFSGCSGLTSINYTGDIAGWFAIDGLEYLMGYGSSTKSLYIDDSLITDDLVIPNGVITIPAYAFRGCTGLTSVTIGNSVTSIGSQAFYGCYKLFEVYNKSSLTITAGSSDNGYVGYYAKNVYTEEGGSKLSTDSNGYVIYTDGADKILVAYTGNSTDLTLPNSITEISPYAFYYCNNLTSITIPNSVTSIGYGAFSGCSSLESITIPFVGAVAGKTASQTYQYPFGYIFGTSSYTSGTEVTQYYYESSTSTTTNTKYYIPSTLHSVTVTGGNILYGAFYNCSMLTSITIPDSVTSIGGLAFYNCTGLTSITIPDSVTSIGSSAFYNCTGLTSITFEENSQLTIIGNYVFDNCTGLTTITIPNGVTYIGDEAFYNCSGLTSVAIPDSVTSIGSEAFRDCKGLTSITIPNSVTSIGSHAFYNCKGLTSVTFEENSQLTIIGNYVFVNCTGLTTITIPNGVTYIGEYAFGDCYGLTSVTIGNSVTSINRHAFYGCYILVEVYNKSSLTITAGSSDNGYVGYHAKNVYTEEGGSKLSTDSNGYVIYTDGTDKILVAYTGNSTDLTLPNSITEISPYAFYYCRGLASVTIGNSVTRIGNYAFYGCTGLASITFDGTKAQWNAISKGSNWNYNTGNYVVHCTDGDIAKS